MKWPNLKFFQVVGVLGFSVGVGNAFAGYTNRATVTELVNQVKIMSETQGNEVAERFASFLFKSINNNNLSNQHFQFLIKKIESIKQNNELINSYTSYLNNPNINLDAATRAHYESQVQELISNNQNISQSITSNYELMQSLHQSITIDKSVILQELEKLRRGGGSSNQFIDSIDRI